MPEPQPLTDEDGAEIQCELAIYDTDLDDFVQCDHEATFNSGPVMLYDMEQWVQDSDGADFDLFQTAPRTVYLCDGHRQVIQEKLSQRAKPNLG